MDIEIMIHNEQDRHMGQFGIGKGRYRAYSRTGLGAIVKAFWGWFTVLLKSVFKKPKGGEA